MRAVRDLKGKRVAVWASDRARTCSSRPWPPTWGSIRGRTSSGSSPPAGGEAPLAEGKVDAYMAFPPDPQDLREKKIGHVVVNSAADRPWSQYFCCTLVANREFVRKHPVATKRAMRAFLKATDLCATEPERVARFLVDRGYTPRGTTAPDARATFPTTSGASTTPRTPSASTRSACARPA